MRTKLMSLLTVIGAVTVLVLAANTVALATTGKAILAGKINTAGTQTSIVRTTPGTALQVKTKSNANAPFAVNGTGKVVNLNVDKVDGLDGGTRAYSWTYTGTSGTARTWQLNGLPNGTYLLTYEVFMAGSDQPAGTDARCYFSRSNSSLYGGESSSVSGAYPNSLSGTALMTQTAGDTLKLICNAESGTWNAGTSQPTKITAIPLAGVVNKGAPTASRVAAK